MAKIREKKAHKAHFLGIKMNRSRMLFSQKILQPLFGVIKTAAVDWNSKSEVLTKHIG